MPFEGLGQVDAIGAGLSSAGAQILLSLPAYLLKISPSPWPKEAEWVFRAMCGGTIALRPRQAGRVSVADPDHAPSRRLGPSCRDLGGTRV